MASSTTPTQPPPSTSIAHSLRAWGSTYKLKSSHSQSNTQTNRLPLTQTDNSLNPLVLATFTTPQHLRPVRWTGLLFTPTLVFTSYTSMHGYKTDAAGLLLAQSGLYLLLAARRRAAFRQKFFTTRGMVRGVTMALCAVDVAAAGLAYTMGDREQEKALREKMRKEWQEKGK
jgi:hypothetical protein